MFHAIELSAVELCAVELHAVENCFQSENKCRFLLKNVPADAYT
jgi:hypothetical protein